MEIQAERVRPTPTAAPPRPSPWQANNLNALRAAAALQVAVHHTLAHFHYAEGSRFVYILSLFPGVPIFFFASGLLISRSLHRTSNLSSYIRNRLLRLYPGLWAAFAVGFALCLLAGFRPDTSVPRFVAWVGGQLSIAQFYNPQFMRAYGTGVLNGSLWTIAVEIQFYALLPVIVMAIRSLPRGTARRNTLLISATVAFAAANRLFIEAGGQLSERPILKFLGVSFIPWFYMFLAGVVIEENFDLIYRFVTTYKYQLLAVATTLLFAARSTLGFSVDNTLNPIVFVCLSTIVMVVSFCLRPVATAFQKKWDVSYGVYLYHMPTVNYFSHRRWPSSLPTVFCVLGVTIVLASLSWKFIETRALQLKRVAPSKR